ncbi:MAG: hypothetical protein AB1345_15065 [Chloroflexota bacterium]
MKNNQQPDKTTKILRWTARGIGSLFAALWILSLFASTISEISHGSFRFSFDEGFWLVVLVLIILVGVIIAWKQEALGGTITLAGAIAFGLFAYLTAGRNKIYIMLFTSIPFLISAILFLICWKRSAQKPV